MYNGTYNPSHPLDRQRIAWWLARPELKTGVIWPNFIGTNFGTLVNGPVWGPVSKPGAYGSLIFDGVNDYVSSVSGISPQLPFSLALSLKFTTTSNNVVFEQDGNNGFSVQVGGASAGTLSCWTGGSNRGLKTNGAYNDGKWHRVLFVCISGGGGIYIDGALASSSIGTNSGFVDPVYSGGQVVIGSRFGSFGINAPLDDLTVWSRTLSSAEVTQDYILSNQGYPGVLDSSRKKRRNFLFAPQQTLNPTTVKIEKYVEAVLADKPTAYLRLGEASGTVAVDQSGNGHTGTYHGCSLGVAGLLTGDPSTSIVLNGSSDYVSIPYSSTFDSNDWTVEAWFTVPTHGVFFLGGRYDGSNLQWAVGCLDVSNSSGTVYVQGRNTSGTIYEKYGTTVVTNNVRHLLTATWDSAAGKMSVYLDGVLDGQITVTGTARTCTTGPVFGQLSNGSDWWPGGLQDVAVYPVSLSADRIKTHYNIGIAVLPKCQLWADASQTSYTDSGKTTAATSSGDLVYVAPDYSGNGNDLTQATSGSRLTYRPAVQNGLAVWRCDTATKFFSVPTGISYNNSTIFVVVKPTTVDASKYRIIFDMYQKLTLSSTIPSKSGNWGVTFNTDADSNQLLVAGQFYVLSARLRAVGSPSAVDLSTGEQGPWPTFTTGSVSYSGGTTHTLGTAGANGDTFDIGELLVYDNALSDTDFQRVIDYLNEKWGLLVPPAGGSTNATVTAVAVPLTGSLPAPAISADVTLSPASLTITASEPAAAESGNAGPAGANQLVTFSEPAPAVTGSANNSPATLVETVSEPAPVVSGNAGFSPAALPLTGTVGAVSISTSGSVSVPVSAITFSSSLPADTISAGAGISQATLLITATAPAPVASAGATPAAGTVIATAALQAVSAAAGAGISPAGLVMGAAAPGTAERGDANVMGSTLTVGMHGPVGSPPSASGAATAVIGANTAIFVNSGE